MRPPWLGGGALPWLAATTLGSLLALVGARQLLQGRPPANPTTARGALVWQRHWSVDPQRRRDAALLLAASAGDVPPRQRQLLRGQGWGREPVAALVLKLDAQAAAANGESGEARQLWRHLVERFPTSATSADGLYALGRQTPGWRRQLLERFPAHPAALAAALEAGDALHLARWGPRWPGAADLLDQSCRGPAGSRWSLPQRQVLAGGLAELGDGGAALHCLGPQRGAPGLELLLGQALLTGDASQRHQGQERLLQLARSRPGRAEARDAVALLSQQDGAETLALLDQLPPSLQASAAVQARRVLAHRAPWRPVLTRWPQDPASWDLQWELARGALLQGRWPQARELLMALPTALLPPPLAARQLFWWGYSAERLGQPREARARWRQLLPLSPGGYYGWRARVRLGEAAELDPRHASPTVLAHHSASPWFPLASGDPLLDRLWRLDQPLEAWELWRTRRGGRRPQGGHDLLLEGSLRLGVGDDWTGLGQLDLASQRGPGGDCASQWQLDQRQHPRRFGPLVQQAAKAASVDPALLLAVAKQESRFSPQVQSAAGAVGLLQLMPATASDLAGTAMGTSDLQDPGRNLQLGARYLQGLLARWNGNPFLSVASYNAGPGAVQDWLLNPAHPPGPDPELWVEAIPYPETRIYTKKVLGNYWSYRLGPHSPCGKAPA